jgi:RNA polymerase sigma-70 factor (ECF subfamily)
MNTVAKYTDSDYDVSVEVLEALRAGEGWAFDEVYSVFASPLKDYITRLIHNEEDAGEMIHDIFTSVWVGCHRRVPAKGIRRLLFAKAKGLAMDYFDHAKVKQKYVEFRNHNIEYDTPVDQYVIEEETGVIIEVYIHDLPPRRQTIFRLRHEDNLSVEEIAATLGLSLSTVRNNLSMVSAGIRDLLYA